MSEIRGLVELYEGRDPGYEQRLTELLRGLLGTEPSAVQMVAMAYLTGGDLGSVETQFNALSAGQNNFNIVVNSLG